MTGEEWDESRGLFSQRYLECWQHHNNFLIDGPCEVRQKWYRSGLSPRTYFAQGGTAFNLSKHVQGMANDLVDSLVSTHYHYRLNPTRIRIESNESLRIWDLSSFTSNHHESRHFICALAEFCADTEVEIMDCIHGKSMINLGRLISSYSQMNTFPEYTLERLDEYFTDLVNFHNVAGFLGVYGNLPFSTFLHGASVLQVIGDPDKLNVAGDDGHAPSEPGSLQDHYLGRIIRRNGVVEESKYFWTYEDGAVCLKRGLVQIGNRLLQKEMIIWPSISLILQRILGPDAPSHSSDPVKKSKNELKASIAAEMMRFLNSLFLHNHLGWDYSSIIRFCRCVYETCGLPVEGSVPQLGGQYLCPILPVSHSSFLSPPLQQVVAYHYRGFVELPERSTIECYEPRELLWLAGWSFYSSPNGKYSYLESLGYLRSEVVKRCYTGLDGYHALLKEFSGYVSEIREYYVESVPPDCFQ